ncbi:MAG: DMT family transporter [Pseudomonadota bacterium]
MRPPGTTEHRDNTLLAVTAIVLAVLGLSLGDALIKVLSANFSIWQIFVLRSVLLVPILVAVLVWRRINIAIHSLGWMTVRSLLLSLMWVCYYLSLPNLDLSVAAAAYYTAPIFITLFASGLLGEPVGRLGWVAVVLGFSGAFVILQPGADSFNVYVLLPLTAAILYALAMILTRTKCRNDHPLTLSLALNVTFIVVGVLAEGILVLVSPDETMRSAYPFLLGDWAVMDPRAWLAMAVLALAVLIGSIGAAIAYQAGRPSTVATFDFSYLVFAAVWGVLFFGEIPDVTATVGIVMILAAGLLAVRR